VQYLVNAGVVESWEFFFFDQLKVAEPQKMCDTVRCRDAKTNQFFHFSGPFRPLKRFETSM